LRHLNLYDTNVSAEGVKQLAAALPDCEIESNPKAKTSQAGDADRAAAQWVFRHRGSIKVRTMAGEEFRAYGPAELPQTHFQLVAIFIDNPAPLDRSGMALLGQLRAVETLGIEHDDLTDDDVVQLGRTGLTKTVKGINFHGRNLTDAGLESLAGWPNLNVINYEQTQATGGGLDKLRGLKLKKLLLGRTQIGDAALAHLPLFSELEHLPLDHTRVTDSGMIFLTKLPALNFLGLNNTAITDEGMTTLQGCSPMLRTLQVNNTQVTAAGLREFRKARPDVTLEPASVD
jgi:hypothetical protein